MRVGLILIASLLAAIPAGAQNFRRMSRVEAEGLIRRDAAIYNGPRTQLSMWIWSDKYTYTAGENLTLKWTVKTNGDLYPYTVFVYRQNNQTGKKTYFPGASAEPTDINGNTAAQGFQPMQMTDTTKGVLIGSGGKFAAVNIPNELGMHTFVVQLRDYTGTRAAEDLLHEDRRGAGHGGHLRRHHHGHDADQRQAVEPERRCVR